MNIILEHSISTLIIPDVISQVSMGIVWDFQLCVETEDITAMSCSQATA